MTTTVESDRLRAAGHGLTDIAHRLGTHGLAAGADGLGHDAAGATVAAAVRHVEADWSKQRAQVVAYLVATGAAAVAAANAYDQVERGIRAAAGGTVRPAVR